MEGVITETSGVTPRKKPAKAKGKASGEPEKSELVRFLMQLSQHLFRQGGQTSTRQRIPSPATTEVDAQAIKMVAITPHSTRAKAR